MFLYDPVTSIPGSEYLFSPQLYHLLLSPPSESGRVTAIAPSTTRTDRTMEQNTPEGAFQWCTASTRHSTTLCFPRALHTMDSDNPVTASISWPQHSGWAQRTRVWGEPQRGFLISPLFLPAPNQLWTSTRISQTPTEEDDSLPW